MVSRPPPELEALLPERTAAAALPDGAGWLVLVPEPALLRVDPAGREVLERRGLIEPVAAALASHPVEPWVALMVADPHGIRMRVRILDVVSLFREGVEPATLAAFPLDPEEKGVPESRARLRWWGDDALLTLTADGVPALWGTDGVRRWMAPPRGGGPAVAALPWGEGLVVVRRDGVLDLHPAPLAQVPAESREVAGAPLVDARPGPGEDALELVGADGETRAVSLA